MMSWCRLTCAVAAPATQIVTHMCYSDFEDILPAIDRMDGELLALLRYLRYCLCDPLSNMTWDCHS